MMRSIVTVLRHDWQRLCRAPFAFVIIAGLIVLPALYAWVNIIGFWNPYTNTSHIQVSIANNDRGGRDERLGEINIGSSIVASLKDNHDIQWIFVDTQTALDDVRSGRSYAAIVIPSRFSQHLIQLGHKDSSRPELEYFVNEKISPIAPKLTDRAAKTLDEQINSTFVSSVSKAVSDTINRSNDTIVSSASQMGDHVSNSVNNARHTITSLRDSLSSFPADQNRQTIEQLRSHIADLNSSLDQASKTISSTQDLIDSMSHSLIDIDKNSTQVIDQAIAILPQITSSTSQSISHINTFVDKAHGRLDSALSSLDDIRLRHRDIFEQLDNLRPILGNDSSFSSIYDRAQTISSEIDTALADLRQSNDQLSQSSSHIDQLMGDIDDATQRLATALSHREDDKTTIFQIQSALSDLGANLSSLHSYIDSSHQMLAQLNAVIDNCSSTVEHTANTVNSLSDSLDEIDRDLSHINQDLSLISSINPLRQLIDSDHLDADKISDFMLSPTLLDTEVIYPVNSYGSGMAPLFTNLAMWAGTFMLVALMRLRVDDDEIELSDRQAYIARGITISLLALAQGLTVSIGDLIIGVQTINAPAFIATAAIASLVYSAIAYMLATTFHHIGKALIMILIIVQIPGAGGMYPIEMLPRFFQAVHPFFPFTYAIDAFRETLAGFYGHTWITSIGILICFALCSYLIGLFIRPALSTLNGLFAYQIARTDLFIPNEDAHIQPRNRITSLMRIIERSKERDLIYQRIHHLLTRYHLICKIGLIGGILVPMIFGIAFSSSANSAAFFLAGWSLYLLAVIAFLIVIEYLRHSVESEVTSSYTASSICDEKVRRLDENHLSHR